MCVLELGVASWVTAVDRDKECECVSIGVRCFEFGYSCRQRWLGVVSWVTDVDRDKECECVSIGVRCCELGYSCRQR